MGMQFLIWYEDNAKKPLTVRLDEACAAFATKFGRAATHVRVHPTTRVPAGLEGRGLAVDVTRTVPPGQVWPGGEVGAGADPPAAAPGGGGGVVT